MLLGGVHGPTESRGFCCCLYPVIKSRYWPCPPGAMLYTCPFLANLPLFALPVSSCCVARSPLPEQCQGHTSGHLLTAGEGAMHSMLGSLWLWSSPSCDTQPPKPMGNCSVPSLSPSDLPSAAGQTWPPECRFQQSWVQAPLLWRGRALCPCA